MLIKLGFMLVIFGVYHTYYTSELGRLYPKINLVNFNSEKIPNIYLVEAMDRCGKFIPNLKQIPLAIVIRGYKKGNTIASCICGNFFVRSTIIFYDYDFDKNTFIRVFIHELFHSLGFGCDRMWMNSIRYQKDWEKYLSLTKFTHAKEYLKTDHIPLSEDGHHFKDEDGDLMTPVYGHQKRITLKSLYILKDLGHIINIIETSDQFFEIES